MNEDNKTDIAPDEDDVLNVPGIDDNAILNDWDTGKSAADETDDQEAKVSPGGEKQAAEDKPTEDQPPAKPEADQSFTLKHLDDVKTVGRDDVIMLAQKGLDYDRIRGKYEELSESLRVQEHLHGKIAETQAAERRQSEIRAFFTEYGTTIDPNVIQPEVWAEVAKGKTLLAAYQAWELKRLRTEIAVFEKNAENKKRSPGSRQTAGAGKPHDDIEDDWYRS